MARPLIAVSLCLLAAGSSAFVQGRPQAGTHLEAAQDFDVEAPDAKVGTVYNYAAQLWVLGPGAVRIVSARALDSDPGFEQLPALLGNNCDGGEYILAEVGADLAGRPKVDLRPMATTRLRQPTRRPCWYVFLRFVPRRLGNLAAHHGEIVYTVAGTTHTVHFDFEGAAVVNGTGHDERDSPNGG